MSDPTPNPNTDGKLARRGLKLAIFDLDGTLKAVRSPYGYVHQKLGVVEQASEIYARYQRGELSYHEWGQHEINLWRGLPIAELKSIISEIPFWPGAVEFVRCLQLFGIKIAVVSAGFDVHVQHCATELGADYVVYNRLGVADGRLTGEFFGTVDGHNKGAFVRDLQSEFQVGRDETLVAGDTSYDVPMFTEAAVSIAVFPSDQEVESAADLLLADGDWTDAWALIERFRPGWLPEINDLR